MAYDMIISDWSSDVCSSDLCEVSRPQPLDRGADPPRRLRPQHRRRLPRGSAPPTLRPVSPGIAAGRGYSGGLGRTEMPTMRGILQPAGAHTPLAFADRTARSFRAAYLQRVHRSEEHTSELQSLMRHSYAVFCLKKKT